MKILYKKRDMNLTYLSFLKKFVYSHAKNH
nr:MAG TPA: hypothetical protein [Caudoviricetes sp.]